MMESIMADENQSYLSHRASRIDHLTDFLSKYMFECIANPWSSRNSDGFVNLGTAENYINEDLIVEKVSTLV